MASEDLRKDSEEGMQENQGAENEHAG